MALKKNSVQAFARLFNHLPRENGQSIVILALVLVGLVAFLGLIFDGGTAYSQRRMMQNAADAAALAGARELAKQYPQNCDVLNAINQYAITKNGAQTVSATYIFLNDGQDHAIPDNCGQPSDQAYAVHVVAGITFNTFFLSILGENNGTVSAEAAVAFGGVDNFKNGVYPIAPQCNGNANSIESCGFHTDTSSDMWDGGGTGNFGWLQWANSNGNPLLCNNMTYPSDMTYTNPFNASDHALSVADWVDGSTGVVNANCIGNALKDLIDNQTKITVIFWGATQDVGGNLKYQIVGFAKFVVEGYDLSHGLGNIYGDISGCGAKPYNCIQGRFIEWRSNADITGGSRNLGNVSFKLVPIPPATPTPGIPPGGTPATPLPTFTKTSTATNTPLPTNTATNTPLPTNTPTATGTSTPTSTSTPTNTPTVTSTSTPGPSPTPTNTATPTATPTATLVPSISVSKIGPSTAVQNFQITFIVQVTNSGSGTLNNVTINDPLLGYISPPIALAQGQTFPYFFNYTVPLTQVTAINNSVTATGNPQSGSPASVTSSASISISCVYPGEPSPLAAAKGANITLSWDPIPGATSYKIFKSTVNTPPFPPCTSCSVPTLSGGKYSSTDNDPPGQGPVYFYITAVNANMCGGADGPPSNIISVN